MASTKGTLLLAILCIALVHELVSLSGVEMGAEAQKIDCSAKCADRCSKSWKPKMCKKTCGVCCERCKCVPEGPKASKDSCPCYANMKTHNGKSKCP